MLIKNTIIFFGVIFVILFIAGFAVYDHHEKYGYNHRSFKQVYQNGSNYQICDKYPLMGPSNCQDSKSLRDISKDLIFLENNTNASNRDIKMTYYDSNQNVTKTLEILNNYIIDK